MDATINKIAASTATYTGKLLLMVFKKCVLWNVFVAIFVSVKHSPFVNYNTFRVRILSQ